MIPGITEHFGADAAHVTLHQATVTFTDMGERVITTQVKVDGDYAPTFEGWYLEFKNEKYILPIRDPQAMKDNTSRNSIIDLTFRHEAEIELKRYFYVTLYQIQADPAVYMPDQYNASMNVNLTNFCANLSTVLAYYYGDKFTVDLNSSFAETPVALLEINNTLIWDVLTKIYDTYGARWYIQPLPDTQKYVIKIGYNAENLSDHDFEYGFEGGLLKFERQVQDDDIRNILLGRGGEKNLPYRYFKKKDDANENWAPDPDAIPELANVYFDRLRDSNFRSYVQGWITNPIYAEAYVSGSGYAAPQPFDNARATTDWAYAKGHIDTKFNPVEYVADSLAYDGVSGTIVKGGSIAKFGERWGALDDNDDVYPTIQGAPNGEDLVVGVSDILTDDVQDAADAAATSNDIPGAKTVSTDEFRTAGQTITKVVYSDVFTIPSGQTCYIYAVPMESVKRTAGRQNTNTNDVIFATDRSSIMAPHRAAMLRTTRRIEVTPCF